MYTVEVKIRGIAPLLQHRYPMPTPESISKGGKATTGSPDYTDEWRQSLYVTVDGEVYQPSSHIERAMAKTAVNFKIPGKRGKTYRDLFTATVFVTPDQILHGVKNPEELDYDPTARLYIDQRPVVVSRARVVRARPAFSIGWTLAFTIEVMDGEISAELVHDVLSLAGKQAGIGDHRPKFGRFQVVLFEKEEGSE